MQAHQLTQQAAADAIGISRRMLNYYLSAEKPIPKTVWLACLILVWPFALVAVLGFVETAFGLRARFSNRGSGPPAANDR